MSEPTSQTRRFYTRVDVVATPEGYQVTLDGRVPKTPGKRPLCAPTEAAARLLADEWAAQIDIIVPDTMPMTRLVNVALDRAHQARDGMVEEVMKYAGTDLVCYRVEGPAALVARHNTLWDPLLDWAGQALGARLLTTTGALAIRQPGVALESLRRHVGALDDLRLTAAAFATGLTGSAVIAMALVLGHIDADTAFKAIRIEEDWQGDLWGHDPDEAKLAEARRTDLKAVAALCRAL